jgi:hypothetical protein
MNLVNATGHQPGEGMPQFLGQSVGRTTGGGSGGRGASSFPSFSLTTLISLPQLGLFRPANLTGSSRHSG